jgi:hypothetical protein
MLIRSWHERQARAEQKTQALLEFLCTEIWTMYPVIGWLIGDGSKPAPRQTVHNLVTRLERDGLLRTWRPERISDTDRGGRHVYVGIRRQGRIRVGADPEARVFEPRQLGDAAKRDHKLFAQKVRILLTARGWSDWEVPEQHWRDENGRAWPVLSDYVCHKDGITYAIEAERTLKSSSRYNEVWQNHIDAVMDGRWSTVLYCLPSAREKASFETIRQRSKPGKSSIFSVTTIDELLSISKA